MILKTQAGNAANFEMTSKIEYWMDLLILKITEVIQICQLALF